jgi:hypothetical protein
MVLDANTQAHKDAGDLEKAFSAGDPAQTWAKLKADLDAHSAPTADNLAYKQAISKELTDRGLMPAAAELMLKQDFSSTFDEEKDGKVSDVRLNNLAALPKYADPFHQDAIHSLITNYNKIATQDTDSDGDKTGPSYIHMGDLDNAITQEHAKYQDISAVNELTKDHNRLFDALDTANWGGKADGQIGYNDLKAFLANPANKEQFSPQDIALVQHLYDDWDKDDVTTSRKTTW